MAVCKLCPKEDNVIPDGMMVEHLQMIHMSDNLGVTRVELTSDDPYDHCPHRVEALMQAYWRLREERSKWISSPAYRSLSEAHATADGSDPRLERDYLVYRAYGDGLTKAIDMLAILAHELEQGGHR